MPTRLPPCPHCQDNLFVRVEWVLSGRRVSSAYYCGRCNHEWRVETAPPARVGERRSADRRRGFRDEMKAEV
jgi:transposase-like protein